MEILRCLFGKDKMCFNEQFSPLLLNELALVLCLFNCCTTKNLQRS